MSLSLSATLRNIRRFFRKSEWLVSLYGLERSEGTETHTGLIFIQIDGLSKKELLRNLEEGRMPFLKSLVDREGYKILDHYSGIPSSTPAVQAEIFYGVKCAVPAFAFIDKKTGRPFKMYEPESAKMIQERLEEEGKPLFKGGSAFSNIYTGGADEPHYCASRMGVSQFLDPRSLWKLPAWLLFNAYSLLRCLILLAIEFPLAVFDFFRGAVSGFSLWSELKFVPVRVAICILYRELIAIGAGMDATRGLPIIQANFLGYDEQAHRRGPDSKFARWTLRGIDNAIARIAREADRSPNRDYRLWLYSDHGQEHTTPYPHIAGRTIQESVAEVFEEVFDRERVHISEHRGIQTHRGSFLGSRWVDRLLRNGLNGEEPEENRMTVRAMGPVGHVYLNREFDESDLENFAIRLVQEVSVPTVYFKTGDGKVRAVTSESSYLLPDQIERFLGPDACFVDSLSEDLVRLCYSPLAGDLVLGGWKLGGEPVSFPLENGAHAGPGPNETHGFALLPQEASELPSDRNYLRPLDLHEKVRNLLHPDQERSRARSRDRSTDRDILRVVTYNVHSCLGSDGKRHPTRIAEILTELDPDIIALQELDRGIERSGGVDQAVEIARHLEMELHFHPSIEIEEGDYGNAILSRHPLHLVKAGPLPTLEGRKKLERRGAIWARVDIGGESIQIFNTHLGLNRQERLRQAQALIGEEWLGDSRTSGPVLMMGDFNFNPRTRPYQALAEVLVDVQSVLEGHTPHKSFPARYPVSRIDHIFASSHFRTKEVRTIRNRRTLKASDHLPLFAILERKQ
ncbi:MAG: endonuclease/exonuclease/phosphatase family protein [Candidatus Omnitrophica bacterium]|nr:endonuclease/exonuclease/phosphatase family protein [Candidatus Omnitrophota bacterium]